MFKIDKKLDLYKSKKDANRIKKIKSISKFK